MFRNRSRRLEVVRIRASRDRTPPRRLAGPSGAVRVGVVAVPDPQADRAQELVPVQARGPDQVRAAAHAMVPVEVRRPVDARRVAVLPVLVRDLVARALDRAAAPVLRDDPFMNFFEASMVLGAAETLDFETAELLIRVENSGDVLYNALAERLNNEEAAELLRKNGREEVGHARRMMKVLTLKTGTEYVPSAEVLEKFEVDLPDSIDASALPMIVEGELQGDLGYQKWAAAETDPEVIELLLRNGREETKHAERIKQAIEILAAAEAAQ